MRRVALLGCALLAGCKAQPGPYDKVAPIIAKHCAACHSTKPTHKDYDAPPLGVVLESPRQVKDQAVRIKALAVTAQTMPLGNETGMTDAEREALGKWIDDGAQID